MSEILQVSAEYWAAEAGGVDQPGVILRAGPGCSSGRVSCQAQLLLLCGRPYHCPGRLSEASCSDA